MKGVYYVKEISSRRLRNLGLIGYASCITRFRIHRLCKIYVLTRLMVDILYSNIWEVVIS